MKQLLFISALFVFNLQVDSQNIIKHAPVGFDSVCVLTLRTEKLILSTTNLKQFWIAMGVQEDIAYNYCQLMLAKFDEIMIKIHLQRISRRAYLAYGRNNLYNFAQLLFK